MTHLHKTLLGASALTLLLAAPIAGAQEAEKDQVLDSILVTGKYLYADEVNALKSPTPIQTPLS